MSETQQDYIRGQQAEAVLTNEAFNRAFAAIENKLIDDFKNTRWFEGAQMKEIHRKLKAAEWLRQALESEMQSGKLAKKRLEAK